MDALKRSRQERPCPRAAIQPPDDSGVDRHTQAGKHLIAALAAPDADKASSQFALAYYEISRRVRKTNGQGDHA
jgi:hypothetical protein